MQTSESIKSLAAALAKAQRAMKPALKDSENPYFSSRYADLAAVVEAIREPLADNGLAFVQGVDGDEAGNVLLVTRLMHESGEWLEATTRMKPGANTPQGIGSTITYARRYALQSMVGVPAEDDDGNAGTGNRPEAKPERKAAGAKAVPKDPKDGAADLTKLWGLLKEASAVKGHEFLASNDPDAKKERDRFLSRYIGGAAIASLAKLPQESIDQMVSGLALDLHEGSIGQ